MVSVILLCATQIDNKLYFCRLPKLKLRRCLFKWLKPSWIRGSRRVHIMLNLKGNPTSLGTLFAWSFIASLSVCVIRWASYYSKWCVSTDNGFHFPVMKEGVACHPISILHTVIHWGMVQEHCFKVGRLGWYRRYVLLML